MSSEPQHHLNYGVALIWMDGGGNIVSALFVLDLMVEPNKKKLSLSVAAVK